MRRLLTGYAVVFNRRHKRVGHLFQNRYKSIVCDGDAYLLELVRYIHLNPLRARIVSTLDSLEAYHWSEHRELLGQKARALIAEDRVLPFFATGRKAARQQYRQFMADGIDSHSEPDFSRGGKRASLTIDPGLADDALFDERILGGGDFVGQVLDLAGQGTNRTEKSLTEIIEQVTTYFGIDQSRVKKSCKERAIAQAKGVICYVAVREQGLKGVDIAQTLAFTPAAVCHAAKRGELLLRKKTMQKSLGLNL
jgi:hypothetical protein